MAAESGAPRVRLGPVVFLAGAGSLATEIGASRLLAPYFGNSTIVWANIIGLILIYLSVGYWVGGRLADKHPSPRWLGRIILVAAALIALLPFISHPILDLALRGFASLSIGAVVGSFIAALLLFAIPVTLLGTVAPFALRLSITDVATAGSVAGRLYALSTMGSIVGTFVPALITIELIGTQRTMIGTAVLLALAAVPLLAWRAALVAGLLALLVAIPPGSVKASIGLLWEKESQYQYVQVVTDGDGSRNLRLNEGVATHSVWRAGTVLTGSEWDMFLITPALLGRPVQNVLIIGNAGGTTARAMAQIAPQASIDGVEIDPVVSQAGSEFLGMNDNPRLHVITADGRSFLRTTEQKYDLIFVDAYRQPYIPFQLTTAEFFNEARAHLTPGGILALNVATIPGDDALPRAIETTVNSQFASTAVWPALHYNELLLGFDQSATIDAIRRRGDAINGAIASLQAPYQSQVRAPHTGAQVLTDDLAPVEWLTDKSLLTYIAGGGNLDEPLLPTSPH